MEIEKDEKGTDELLALIGHNLLKGERGEEIHISDLESPLRAYHERVYPGIPYGKREVGYFIVGQGHHVALLQAVAEIDGTQEGSFTDEETGIIYSPDLITWQGEFKTSRWWKIPDDFDSATQALSYYFEQCAAYAAFMQDRLIEKNTWKLVVLYICPSRPGIKGKYPEIVQYKLRWSDEELIAYRAHMKETADTLRRAIADKDPSELPLCSPSHCWEKVGRGRGKKALHEPRCRYFHICKPKDRWDLWKEEHPDED